MSYSKGIQAANRLIDIFIFLMLDHVMLCAKTQMEYELNELMNSVWIWISHIQRELFNC